jgi:hypothetical protein
LGKILKEIIVCELLHAPMCNTMMEKSIPIRSGGTWRPYMIVALDKTSGTKELNRNKKGPFN